METYWCTKKNSIVSWINNGVDFDPALTPCLKSECDRWREGECIHLRKVENQRIRVSIGRSQERGYVPIRQLKRENKPIYFFLLKGI
jgi:hypothetical protein